MQILSSDSESDMENITLAVSEEVQTIENIIQPFSNLNVNSDSQGKSFLNHKIFECIS